MEKINIHIHQHLIYFAKENVLASRKYVVMFLNIVNVICKKNFTWMSTDKRFSFTAIMIQMRISNCQQIIRLISNFIEALNKPIRMKHKTISNYSRPNFLLEQKFQGKCTQRKYFRIIQLERKYHIDLLPLKRTE